MSKQHYIQPLSEALYSFMRERTDQILLEVEHCPDRNPQYAAYHAECLQLRAKIEEAFPECRDELDRFSAAMACRYGEIAIETYKQGVMDGMELLQSMLSHERERRDSM